MEEITSRKNEKVKFLADLGDDAKLRTETGLCVAHGTKLCVEAARFGCGIEQLWVTKRFLDANEKDIGPLVSKAKMIFFMSEEVCEKISPLRTPQGVVAAVKYSINQKEQQYISHNRIAALCAVQDPANVGAVIRVAAGLGYETVIMDGQCADPFSPKALRASMGAAFAIDIVRRENLADEIDLLKKAGHKTIAAALVRDAINISDIDTCDKLTIVFGNEGKGLPSGIISSCHCAAVIPISDKVESLNIATAAAIAMWELRICRPSLDTSSIYRQGQDND